jgi:hypothetical protein
MHKVIKDKKHRKILLPFIYYPASSIIKISVSKTQPENIPDVAKSSIMYCNIKSTKKLRVLLLKYLLLLFKPSITSIPASIKIQKNKL